MSLNIWFSETPWGFIEGKAQSYPLIESPLETIIKVETFFGYLIVPDQTIVRVDGCKIPPEKQSPVFYYQGHALRRLLLPSGSRKNKGAIQDQKISFECRGVHTTITLSIPSEKKFEKVDSIIKMQIERFQSLLDHYSFTNPSESEFRLGVRRAWSFVSEAWLGCALKNEETPTSFITQKAQDTNLSSAIQAVLKMPSRRLQRERDFVTIAAAAEMDSACLEWYCKRPGETLAEKARQDQTILGIRRKETFYNLENRVSSYVIEGLLALCHQYLKDHVLHLHSDKYNAVKKFDGMIRYYLTQSSIKDVSPCDHMESNPNYVLTHHHAYKMIWEVYLQLKKEHRLFEDSQKWKNTLWTETGSQLVSSLLYHFSKLKYIKELAASIPYYRKESICGQRIETPITPGPFSSRQGIIDYIDCRDGEPPQSLSNWMGIAGCQQVLHQKRPCGTERTLALWYWFTENSERNSLSDLQKSVEALEKSKFIFENKPVEIGALILANTPNDQITTVQLGFKSPIWVIFIPSDYRNNIDELIDGFEQVLQFFDS